MLNERPGTLTVPQAPIMKVSLIFRAVAFSPSPPGTRRANPAAACPRSRTERVRDPHRRPLAGSRTSDSHLESLGLGWRTCGDRGIAARDAREDSHADIHVVPQLDRSGYPRGQGSPETRAGRELAKKVGVEIKQLFLTSGDSDIVLIVDAPDGDNVAKFALSLGSLGNVRTRMTRLWPEADFEKLISELP
jgi:uncharacterized protein with GYD domain